MIVSGLFVVGGISYPRSVQYLYNNIITCICACLHHACMISNRYTFLITALMILLFIQASLSMAAAANDCCNSHPSLLVKTDENGVVNEVFLIR